jgi:predicted nucleotidyltransferase
MANTVAHLSVAERSALAEIERRVSALLPVRRYVLFGSKARGDSAPDSDVDLLIVTERKADWRQSSAISREVFLVNLQYDTLFSTVTVSAEEWEGELYRVLPLHKAVDREGVPV